MENEEGKERTQNSWEHPLLTICLCGFRYGDFFFRQEGLGVQWVLPVEGLRGSMGGIASTGGCYWTSSRSQLAGGSSNYWSIHLGD
jgi:hypothetical protein